MVHYVYTLLSCTPRKIQLDEIEPLSAHTRVRKVVCLFYSIGNIHTKFHSQLKVMFLVTLVTPIHAHRIDEVLRPFIKV